MELYQLQYFVAVVEERSFTRAARRCAISQPALSQQVQKLERELGQPLFERLSRRLELTEAGRMLYEKATQILRLAQEAQTRIGDLGSDVAGRLVVGSIPTVAPYLLPEVVQQFQRAYPKIELFLVEDLTPHLIERCVRGDVDLAVMAEPVAHDQLVAEKLWTERLLLALPQNHRLTRKRTVSLADLGDEPFILLDEMHCLGQQIVAFCNRQAYSPRVCCRSAQLLTIQRMVSLGHGVSLVPEMAALPDCGVMYRNLRDRHARRTLIAVRHKHRFLSRAAREWLRLLHQAGNSIRQRARGRAMTG